MKVIFLIWYKIISNITGKYENKSNFYENQKIDVKLTRTGLYDAENHLNSFNAKMK